MFYEINGLKLTSRRIYKILKKNIQEVSCQYFSLYRQFHFIKERLGVSNPISVTQVMSWQDTLQLTRVL